MTKYAVISVIEDAGFAGLRGRPEHMFFIHNFLRGRGLFEGLSVHFGCWNCAICLSFSRLVRGIFY